MTARHSSAALLRRDEIVAAPLQRACQDRTFELPPVLHVMAAVFFLGFVSVLNLAFRTHMLVSYGVFVAFIAAFFTVPALWTRMKLQENPRRALSWDEFMRRGIVTQTGRVRGPDATVLVLLLPFVVFCWAVAIVNIAVFLWGIKP